MKRLKLPKFFDYFACPKCGACAFAISKKHGLFCANCKKILLKKRVLGKEED